MQILNKFNEMSITPDLGCIINTAQNKNNLDFNCMRIAIVQEFYPEDLTVSVLIANKKTINQTIDGTQGVRDYALIRAKVCYCNPFITNPIQKGDECILLFNDREIESWFINGGVNAEAYTRMHDLTDAVAIFGIRSLPNMIQILNNCLHLFYGNCDIQIKENGITITGAINQTGNITSSGAISGASLNAKDGASNYFISQDNKKVTVVNGIITSIQGVT